LSSNCQKLSFITHLVLRFIWMGFLYGWALHGKANSSLGGWSWRWKQCSDMRQQDVKIKSSSEDEDSKEITMTHPDLGHPYWGTMAEWVFKGPYVCSFSIFPYNYLNPELIISLWINSLHIQHFLCWFSVSKTPK
jgi:hypothetical protein